MSLFRRTPAPAPAPRHRADVGTPEMEVWVSKAAHTRRPEPDYSSWVTSTHEIVDSAIYEARAIVRNEGGLIVKSTTLPSGKLLLTVITPPVPADA